MPLRAPGGLRRGELFQAGRLDVVLEPATEGARSVFALPFFDGVRIIERSSASSSASVLSLGLSGLESQAGRGAAFLAGEPAGEEDADGPAPGDELGPGSDIVQEGRRRQWTEQASASKKPARCCCHPTQTAAWSSPAHLRQGLRPQLLNTSPRGSHTPAWGSMGTDDELAWTHSSIRVVLLLAPSVFFCGPVPCGPLLFSPHTSNAAAPSPQRRSAARATANFLCSQHLNAFGYLHSALCMIAWRLQREVPTLELRRLHLIPAEVQRDGTRRTAACSRLEVRLRSPCGGARQPRAGKNSRLVRPNHPRRP